MARANGGDYGSYSNPWDEQNQDPWNTSVDNTSQTGISAPTEGSGDDSRRYETTPEPNDKTVDTSSWDTNGYATPGYTTDKAGSTPAGWDSAKWSDPNHQSPKYVVGRIMSQYNLQDAGERNQAIADIQKAYPGTTFDGHDTVTIPGIGPVDIFGGASGGEYRPQWLDLTADAQSQQGQAGGMAPSLISQFMSQMPTAPVAAPSAGGGGWTGDPTALPPGATDLGNNLVRLANGMTVDRNNPWFIQAMGGNPQTGGGGNLGNDHVGTEVPAEQTRKNALLDLLTQRMNQTLNIDGSDPIIKNQVDAYGAQAERARRNYLADTAEANSPYATGAQRGEERMTAEKLGQDVGSFQGELIGRELTAKRQEIQDAIESMGNLLTDEEHQALQKEIHDIDSAIERQRVENQNSQYYAGLSQNDKQFYANLSQQDRLAMLDDAYRRASLGQNQSQWLDKMGFDSADRQRYWDAVDRGLI